VERIKSHHQCDIRSTGLNFVFWHTAYTVLSMLPKQDDLFEPGNLESVLAAVLCPTLFAYGDSRSGPRLRSNDCRFNQIMLPAGKAGCSNEYASCVSNWYRRLQKVDFLELMLYQRESVQNSPSFIVILKKSHFFAKSQRIYRRVVALPVGL
jgi:hypothetical protein